MKHRHRIGQRNYIHHPDGQVATAAEIRRLRRQDLGPCAFVLTSIGDNKRLYRLRVWAMRWWLTRFADVVAADRLAMEKD